MFAVEQMLSVQMGYQAGAAAESASQSASHVRGKEEGADTHV